MRIQLIAASLAVFVLSTACGQQQPPAPGAGPGYGMGPGGMGPGRGPWYGSDYTPGWSMMTPQERDEHRRRMLAARTPEECRQIRDEQVQRMTDRARAQGATTLPMPMRDACAGMQP